MSKAINVDKRISAIVNMIPKSNTIADIGCDHGKTSLFALLKEKTAKVIATDISAPSLNKAKRLAKKYGVSERFDFRCGDGLSVLKKGEADTIMISGIGGELMERLLETEQDKLNKNTRLVLAPNNRAYIVRQWLNNHRFEIVDETLVEEGKKFYQIICAKFGFPQPLSPVEFAFGKHILKNGGKTIVKLLTYEAGQIEDALINIRKSRNAEERQNELENKLVMYQETLKWLKSQSS